MTTNENVNEIQARLEQAAKKDVNIKISYQIDQTVNFLDLTIMNECGRLRTTIYHKPAAEPYILPFTSTHPYHIHRNIPYGALLRAARICSNADDFHFERCRIDISLLLNGYPPHFIQKQFHRLSHTTDMHDVVERMNANEFASFHHKLLHQPTRHEQKLQKMMMNPIEQPLVLQPYIWDCKTMFPSYLYYHPSPIHLSDDFMKWWRLFFSYPGSPVYNAKVQLVPKTQRTLEDLFIKKKPRKELLTRME